MDNQKRLFRILLLAGLGVTADAFAYSEEETYDLPRIRATIPSLSDVEGAGGGGYYGAASSFDDSAYEDLYEQRRLPSCDEVLAGVPDDCDLANPPSLLPNGCGGGPTQNIIPDSLVLVRNGYASIAFEGIFTEACNKHDICYSTVPGDKAKCDEALVPDLVEAAMARVPPASWQFFGNDILDQINAYGFFFSSSAGGSISKIFFDAAQDDAVCVNYSHAVQLYCRSFQ